MSQHPMFTLRPEADPRVSLIMTIALSGSAVVLGCIGFIGVQEGWWDEIISYVFYFTAVVDAILGIVLPRFIAGQTSRVAYDFYDDRMELGDGKRRFLTVSYDHVLSVSEDQTDKQKLAGRVNIQIEVDKEALNTQTGSVSKTLHIINVSNSNKPANRIREALEEYERHHVQN